MAVAKRRAIDALRRDTMRERKHEEIARTLSSSRRSQSWQTRQAAKAYGRACLSLRYSVAAPIPSFSAALARLPPEACSAAAM
jgi:hypothetical protein